AMQFRYALIPYLYSMAWREHHTGATLIRPMYYADPLNDASYHAPNQYLFGSELIAAPFTSPRDADTRLTRQTIWLPEGEWYSFPNGRWYKGGRWHAVYGRLEDIPLFACAGAILPLSNDRGWSTWQTPERLQVHIFPGASNHFDLYEDDGETMAYQEGAFAITPMDLDWQKDRLEFRISPARGESRRLPGKRTLELNFYGLVDEVDVELIINGSASTPELIRKDSCLKIIGVIIYDGESVIIRIRSRNGDLRQFCDYRRMLFRELIKAFRLQTVTKSVLNTQMEEFIAHPERLGSLRVSLTDTQVQALLEATCGFGFTRLTQDGKDRIVLWNPDRHPGFVYQFSIEQANQRISDHYTLEVGQVPEFRVFDLTKSRFQDPWRFQIQYLDQLHFVHTNLGQVQVLAGKGR
ncbi:MAG: glycoside hydrolase family 31 protein, partial [Anaerolineales bacterium]